MGMGGATDQAEKGFASIALITNVDERATAVDEKGLNLSL